MHARDLFDRYSTTFSFEFFPPKTPDAADQLFAAITELEPLKPSFVSITYGAGGSTRDLTHELVVRLKQRGVLDPVPHLTCVCHSEPEVRAILERYAQAGIGNVLALGGDVPKERPGYDRAQDAFQNACGLAGYVKAFNDQNARAAGHPDERGFGIGVAGYPEGHPGTPNRVKEMDFLKAKVDAGADYIVTQLFFSNDDFYDFRDRCGLAGIRVPIVAGIMPITSASGMMRMADMAAGTRFPAPLLRSINRASGDAEGVRRVGIHWATEQCRDLLDHNVRGIHFYTLNRSTATREIYQNLGVKDSTQLQPVRRATH